MISMMYKVFKWTGEFIPLIKLCAQACFFPKKLLRSRKLISNSIHYVRFFLTEVYDTNNNFENGIHRS